MLDGASLAFYVRQDNITTKTMLLFDKLLVFMSSEINNIDNMCIILERAAN